MYFHLICSLYVLQLVPCPHLCNLDAALEIGRARRMQDNRPSIDHELQAVLSSLNPACASKFQWKGTAGTSSRQFWVNLKKHLMKQPTGRQGSSGHGLEDNEAQLLVEKYALLLGEYVYCRVRGGDAMCGGAACFCVQRFTSSPLSKPFVLESSATTLSSGLQIQPTSKSEKRQEKRQEKIDERKRDGLRTGAVIVVNLISMW